MTSVGMLGLGIMGGAYARHLIAAGFDVVGYDPLPVKRASLQRLRGRPLASPAAVAAQATRIVTSLPSVAAFEFALFGRDGLARAARRGTIVIETSTLPVEVKERARRRLAALGVTLLDCPVSGTGAQAAAKDIVVYVSGERRACTHCRTILAGLSRSHYYCGEFGTGSKLKIIANLLVTIHNLSTAEAFVLAERAGVDAKLMYRVIGDGAGSSRMFELRGPMMLARRYQPPAMKVDIFQKDLAIIGKFATAVRCPTPLFSVAKRYHKAALQDYSMQDTAAVHAVLRRKAANKRR
jgi:3-hydroxyisobutyrate dehydrogenase-like beta-hydroxyacid dehydrogenase